MVSYWNGYIPEDLLITIDQGWSAGEGTWKHQLSAGTLAKHRALVELARANTGKELKISSGWGAYRPYAAQEYAQKVHGRGAAEPGKSSHGGFWEGKQTLAIDYGNWSYVYNGDRNAFYRDVRAVGLTPGMISIARGYPDEPWHVIDLYPWAAPAGGGATPFTTDRNEYMDIIRCANIDGNNNPGVAVLNDAAPLKNPAPKTYGANPLIILDKYSGAAAQVQKWERALGMKARTLSREDWELRVELTAQTRAGK